MAQEMEKLGGTSEEEDEEEMEMEVKEEDDEDEGGSGSAGAAVMGMTGTPAGEDMGGRYFEQPGGIGGGSGGGEGMMQGGAMRRPRPKEEKERTKLRERHRRAITARILSGLRRHGNYNLRARADINEVIAALAREAGWVVLPDGTTFPSRSSASSSPQAPAATSSVAPAQIQPIRGVSPGGGFRSVEYRPLKGVFTPTAASYDGRSRTAVMMGGHRERMVESSPLAASCTDGVDGKQVTDIPPTQRMPERDFAGTPYVPVYVMLPLGVINMKCELVDPDSLIKQLRILKSVNVDGVMVDCWWGIVEAHASQEYNWHGYKKLFQIVRELKLKLQVVMSFHECGGNIGDDVCIPLPHWIAEIGRSNPDIFFTDGEGRRNPECLSWGIDKERVLRGRTGLEVYFDYMRSFRVEFDEFFEDGIISEIEVGLGPCGELRYPSYPVKHGWRYPGIGEFQKARYSFVVLELSSYSHFTLMHWQNIYFPAFDPEITGHIFDILHGMCYDQYLMKSLRKAAEARGHSFWARGPENAGSYNSRPHETGFFCDGGDYDSYYGRFFLNWYSQVLVDHCDRVLSLAKLAFEGTCIAAKISGIHWWYKTASHAAELTAGFYNPCNRDGYASIASMLKKHGAALNFTCVELRTLDQHEEFPEALADPEGLVWQVLNAAWDVCIPVASENALPCHDRDGYNKILENSKPMHDPDGRHLSAFTYLRLSPDLMERHNFLEFERFVKRMHGKY
ncbi:Beta-amylase 7 [Cocos nucifera]|uniref:Beta-amylase n=1 Tax=Cocos nucifera TaxID=13894 RepID=A0A8K0N583_COCNU|nr:Beta-amylase 7 [Cocos nucifera]